MNMTIERAKEIAAQASPDIDAALENQEDLALLLRADGSYSIEDADNALLIIKASQNTTRPFVQAIPALYQEGPEFLANRILEVFTFAPTPQHRQQRILRAALNLLLNSMDDKARLIFPYGYVTEEDIRSAFADIGIAEDSVERNEPVFKDAMVSISARVEIPLGSTPVKRNHRFVGFAYRGDEYVFGINVSRNAVPLTLAQAQEQFKAIGESEVKYQDIT